MIKRASPIQITFRYLFIILPVFLILVLIGLLNSPWFDVQPTLLAPAVTADFLIIIPGLYLILIRNKRVSNFTVVPLFFGCFWLSKLIIPEEHSLNLWWIQTYILPVGELTLITFVIYKVVGAYRQTRKSAEKHPDVFELLKSTTASILPLKASRLAATELAVLYYAITIGKRSSADNAGFAYHRKSSSSILLIFLAILIGLETVVFHLLLQHWSSVAAWILTGLSLYTFLQVLGFIGSYRKRPVLLDGETIRLRHGITVETDFHVNQIKSIDKIPTYKHPKDSVGFSILGKLDAFNILLEFNDPVQLTWIYGFKKSANQLSIFIDEPDQFIKAIEELKAKTE